ncbi:hypothetical protein IEQ34_000667 [Dendrobium chrysotoxum]|uniref:Uncharacterized protein n=1 Tax=Dendrobium chrysotoxum TaxID=161865 RepID=A0AAV7HT25_DENCH|nr:hypothetical protein IEQ34_026857 [Dendrobium chrysotoxum]KAH0470944.1 hypothetical protein IEQ34_000667 [Dendrobium chrysotoxum]
MAGHTIEVLTPVFPAAAMRLSPAAGESDLEKTLRDLKGPPFFLFPFLNPPTSSIFSNHQLFIFMAAPPLPPWLSSPSVTLTLSPSTAAPSASSPRLHIEKGAAFDLAECCRDLEEKHSALAAHKKEAAWHLRRVEQQLEAEKACRKRETMEEVEAKVKKMREEQAVALERIDAEYKEQLMVLRRDAEAKEQKLVEQWAAKHAKVRRLMEQMGCCRR